MLIRQLRNLDVRRRLLELKNKPPSNLPPRPLKREAAVADLTTYASIFLVET